jgi:NAD(P)H-dependent FMN reductase
MKIQVIIGTTRPTRTTERTAKWVMNSAAELEGVDFELVDLLDYELPFFNETISPKYNPNRQPEAIVAKWLAKLGEADGYIIVTPEYNRTMPGVLKNALDYIDWQLDRKPVAIVSHGGNGGTLAAENVRAAIRQLGAINVTDAATITGASELISEDGQLAEAAKANPYGPQGALTALFNGLLWYAKALKVAREA